LYLRFKKIEEIKMSIDFSTYSYNDYSDFPLFAYRCVSHLIDDTNISLLWKLLYYDDNDAWKEDAAHPDLTRAQKGALVYNGSINETDYRVFLDIGAPDPEKFSRCQIRISPALLEPTTHIIGKIVLAAEVYSHFSVNTLSSYQTRTDTVAQLMLSSLNGAEISGIGRLYFDRSASRQCGMSIIGTIPIKGRRIIFANNIT